MLANAFRDRELLLSPPETVDPKMPPIWQLPFEFSPATFAPIQITFLARPTLLPALVPKTVLLLPATLATAAALQRCCHL
jgi:hypothetical protein